MSARDKVYAFVVVSSKEFPLDRTFLTNGRLQ